MTLTLDFDERNLCRDLERIPADLRVAFAAACAERQLPAYRLFCEQVGKGDPSALEGALARLWADLFSVQMSELELKETIEHCLSLIPSVDEEPWTEQLAHAEDAAASVVYALRARLKGDSREAAWSARRAVESLDQFVMRKLGRGAADLSRQVRTHPLLQAELQRQTRDLTELREIGGIPRDMWAARLEEFRTRSRAEASRFFML